MNLVISSICAESDQINIESIFDDVYSEDSVRKNLRGVFKGGFNYFEDYSLKASISGEIVAVLIGQSCDIFFELEDVYDLEVKGFDDLREKNGFKSYILIVKEEYRKKGIAAALIKSLKDKNPELRYLWGIQREDISDMGYFIKNREVVIRNKETKGLYTVQRFK